MRASSFRTAIRRCRWRRRAIFGNSRCGAFTEKVDTDALGAHWLDVYCDALECLREFVDE